MEWIFCESRLPEQIQLCVVACHEWDLFADDWSSIRYRILEYLPDFGIWNIKEPIVVLAWMPIPEFTSRPEISVPSSRPNPHKAAGCLQMPEPEEDADEDDTSIHYPESLAAVLKKIQSTLEKAQSQDVFYETNRKASLLTGGKNHE